MSNYRFLDFELSESDFCLSREGQRIALEPKALRVLTLLVSRAGCLVDKQELLGSVWPDTFVEENTLTRTVAILRRQLGDSSRDSKLIETVPTRGYRFIGTVTQGPSAGDLPADEADGYQAQSVADDSQARSVRHQLPGVIWWEHRGIDALPQTKSIVVRQLKNTSGDDSQNYFAEILTEALVSELARIHQLKVFSSSTIPDPWIANGGLRNPAGMLHFDMLVEGSMRRLSNKIQIIVKIFDLSTRAEIWSQNYDRDLGEILAVQKEVASTIATHIRADPTPYEQAQSGPTLTVEPEAYDCYLRGRFYAQHQNKADNETAMLAFERAIKIDPAFALAYAELAQTYVWKLFLFAPHERQWQEKAFVSVEKALSIDPHLAVAYLARGRLLWTPANHFPHVKAIREYRRALALNPNLDEARNQLALIYCHIGYFEEALREAQEAASTNPNNNLAVYRTAQTLVFQGKHEQALVVLRTIPQDVNPSLIGYQTAWVLFNLGKVQDASETVDQLLKDYPEDDGALFISLQAILAASAGEESVAETKIELAIRTGKGFGHFHHAAYQIAIAFTLMNKPRQAVRWLEFASIDGFPCYPLFEHDKNLKALRQDARFVEFMTGLRHQWVGFRDTL
jgi:DNA-binding winged helix-turn-helix (wHTH) protein/TolB-like protein/Tfp pilus assembly protein PilF